MSEKSCPPIVLVIAGNDPSGGAGLCADIQTLAQWGCHAAPVVTCATVQNTTNIQTISTLAGTQVTAQAETILADVPIAVCKIGLLGSVEIIEAVADVLRRHPTLKVVLDPILAAGGGHPVATAEIRTAMLTHLLPLTYLLTPNSQEARALADTTESLEVAATRLLDYGCQAVCVTGTHEDTPMVVNTLYGQNGCLGAWTWERLPDSYHGSGCTFAASVAGLLAKEQDLVAAVAAAQFYTWNSLQKGWRPGHGQFLPMRVFSNC